MRSRLLFAVIAVAGCAQQETPVVSCAALMQGCTIEPGKLFAKTDNVPTPLKPFALSVAAPAAQEVHVELHMQGMEMGLNRYRLIQQPNGEWRATVTLPACVAGRRDWLMVIEVDGARRTLAFRTG
jgi:hypothetical protein